MEEVSYPDPRMETILKRAYGCILYQEDVMAATMLLAGTTASRADDVRRILGKKKVELVVAEGEKFIPACAERGMDRNAAAQLWEQLAEFSRYSFNKAHAFAYAVLGFWTAWFKFHFPREFLVAALSTVDKARIPDFVNEARRMGYEVLPPDINDSGRGFSGKGVTIRYGLDSVKGVAEKAMEALLQGQPYASWDDFLERKGEGCAPGHQGLAQVGAFDRWFPNRRVAGGVPGAQGRRVRHALHAQGHHGQEQVQRVAVRVRLGHARGRDRQDRSEEEAQAGAEEVHGPLPVLLTPGRS
jgi:DNA polymerase-3 subunit alpha